MTVDGPSTMVTGTGNPQSSLSSSPRPVTAAATSVVAAAAVMAAKALDPPFAHSTT